MKYSEKIERLEYHASSCQMAADEMAVKLIIAQSLIIVQDICDFNIFWLYNISPVILRIETIDFLKQYTNKFKRKISMKEMLYYDALVYWNKPSRFKDFKDLLNDTSSN